MPSAGGNGLRHVRVFALDPSHVRVSGQPGAARRQGFGGQTSEVFDQRQLQHAGPRPQLADRQRRDALVAVDEHRELLTVDAAVAVAHQLDGHRVDPCMTRLLSRRERGQLPVVGARQMLADVPDLRRDQVEVVEQPFRRGGDELPGPDIVRQRAVGLAQYARVVVESRKDVSGAAPRVRVDGEARRERQRTLFQPLDAEQLVAKRLLQRWHCGPPQRPEQSAHATNDRGNRQAAVFNSAQSAQKRARMIIGTCPNEMAIAPGFKKSAAGRCSAASAPTR